MSTATSTGRRKDGRRGFALPMVLMMLVVAMLSVGAFLTVAFFEFNQSTREERHAQALFLAQAGLQRAMADAADADDLSTLTGTPYTDVELGPGTYTVEIVTASGGGIIVRSTGTVQERQRTIEQRLTRD